MSVPRTSRNPRDDREELQPELTAAVQECLKERGVIDKVTATVRAEIVKAIKTNETSAEDEPEALSTDNFLLNELIVEYLSWNGHENAAQVLLTESGQPRMRLSRGELENQLRVQCGVNAKKVPLLYSLLSSVRNKK